METTLFAIICDLRFVIHDHLRSSAIVCEHMENSLNNKNTYLFSEPPNLKKVNDQCLVSFICLVLTVSSGKIAVVSFFARKYSAIRRTPILAKTSQEKTDFPQKNRAPYN